MAQIVVQHIEIVWSKKSRGGDGARVRNSMPDAVRMPQGPGSSPCMLHQATFSEWQGFDQQDTTRMSTTFEELGLKFLSGVIDDAGLTITFHRDGYNAATPSIFPYKPLFTLQEGEFGRFLYNGRYTDNDTGEWWYEKHVYNVGWLTEWHPDLFINNTPQAEFRELARLL